MKISLNTKKYTKFISLAIVIAILVILFSYGVFAKQVGIWPFSKNTQNSSSSNLTAQDSTDPSQSIINDQKQSDLEKQQQAEQNATENSENSSEIKQVDVIITTYSQTEDDVRVNGFVKNIIENDGICTLTLTDKTGKKVARSRNAETNATNTTCGQSIIPIDALHKGIWTTELSYSSKTSAGTSQPNAIPEIEIK